MYPSVDGKPKSTRNGVTSYKIYLGPEPFHICISNRTLSHLHQSLVPLNQNGKNVPQFLLTQAKEFLSSIQEEQHQKIANYVIGKRTNSLESNVAHTAPTAHHHSLIRHDDCSKRTGKTSTRSMTCKTRNQVDHRPLNP